MEGAPVVEHQRRPAGEPAHQPVPHHPAASGEVEQPVTSLQVRVQQVLFLMLQERPPGAVHDALRDARGTGRVEDIERMIERVQRELGWGRARAELLPENRARGRRAEPRKTGLPLGVGDHHHTLDRGELREHLRHRRERIELLARVEIAVGGEEHARCDLPEAVEHAAHAEVRRAGRPDGADRRRGEHRDSRLRQVRHEARDAITRRHARGAQAPCNPRHLAAQLPVREAAPRAALVAEHQSFPAVVEAEEILGEVEARLRKEARPGHALGVLDDRARAPLGAHVGKARELAPERRRLGERPRVELGVVAEARAAARVHAAREAREVRIPDARRGGAPQL